MITDVDDRLMADNLLDHEGLPGHAGLVDARSRSARRSNRRA
jgi:hypothetical protein